MAQDTSEVQHEVDEARDQLGETVEALAYKVNAPKRAKEHAVARVADAKQKLEATKEQITSNPHVTHMRSRAESVKATVDHVRGEDHPGTVTTGKPSPGDCLEPIANTLRRLPPKTTAIGIGGLTLGMLVGRRLGKRPSD
jgi:hypothetical protein